ncbi:hypothetical protein KIN20_005664 [Parelaphostrongylus tenuis]|uniref:Uncharacterized protein n=1 Tax=Parelaphostrongylus tenuis TaxID=148309 RepID=A0AAD5QKC7_PARTN|nr:hypothetical protein KIN20_005664 [Parelaphostrongylus tenuis]
MTRRRRHLPTSRFRFAAAHHFRILLDSVQSEIKRAGSLSKSIFPILEKLVGIVGEKTILEAVRWQQSGLVRLLEGEPDRKPPRRQLLSRLPLGKTSSPMRGSGDPASTTSSTSSTSIVSSSTHTSDLSLKSLVFFEVMPTRALYNSHYLLPNVNYCTCKYFQKQVVKRRIESHARIFSPFGYRSA